MNQVLESCPRQRQIGRIPCDGCHPDARLQLTVDTDTCWTGYLADSEGIPCGPRITVPRDALVGSHAKIRLAGKGSRNDATLRTSSRGHRRHGREKKQYHCRRWIQRIYSHTPHKFSIVPDITGLDDIIPTSRLVTESSRHDKTRLPVVKDCPSLNVRIPCIASPWKHSVVTNDTAEWHEQDEFLTLQTIMSALMEDYHKIQAQYQSYAPLSTN
jgi:hypothetical protein